MLTGVALIELVRRRTKLLPRHFVLAVTADRVVACKAVGGSDEGRMYTIRIFDGEKASFPRASVSMSGLDKGSKSTGGTMTIDGESFPVFRPNMNGEPNTDELIA